MAVRTASFTVGTGLLFTHPQLVHEMLSTFGTRCGMSVMPAEWHDVAKPVTCLWCASRVFRVWGHLI